MLSKRRSTIAATLPLRFEAATRLRVIFSIVDSARPSKHHLSDYFRSLHPVRSVLLIPMSLRLCLPDAIRRPGRVGKRGFGNIGRKKLRERKKSPCSLNRSNSRQSTDKRPPPVI